ncbi:hypothetical protein [Staphylococcus cohnii]|uniref:hypothetical protein n=1 Tax=Staphylococcus cohnii TaxID=29382 RepID=UPI00254AC649|nr:hypothetical protein [Staphylococcus cohnii]WIL68950.1 hypothetical protein QMK35_09425 [Staphylococcus cohnii]
MGNLENLSGQQFGDYEIIGDTGKRDVKNGHQIVIARNKITNELFETRASNFKHGLATGYIGSKKHKENLFIDDIHRNTFLSIYDKNSKTGYSGIYYNKHKNRWGVVNNFKGKVANQKYFKNFEDAVIYLNDWKIQHINPLITNKTHKFRKVDIRNISKNNYVLEKEKLINSSEYQNRKKAKGICWKKDKQKWQAYININKKRKHLGYFENEQDAINARQEAVEKYFNQKGDF